MPSLSPGYRLLSGTLAVSALLSVRSPASRGTDAMGIVCTVTNITEIETPDGTKHFDTSVTTQQYAGDNGRSAFVRLPSILAGNRDSLSRALGFWPELYTLLKRGRSTVTVVDTMRKQYFDVDQSVMVQNMARPLIRLEMHAGDTVFAVRVQPDTLIDGLHAQHWRLTDNHSASAAALTSFSLSMRSVSDEYIALDATGPGSGFPSEELRGAALDSTYANARRAAIATLPPGLKVLAVTRTVSAFGQGLRQVTQTRTDRMSGIQHVDLPTAVFAIPASYTRVAAPTVPALPGPR
jgi:hypothetical protein